MAWRQITDWGKRYDYLLRLADRLGRGRGRLRLLDHLAWPRPCSRPDLTGWADARFAAIWIGHATVLLRLGDKTILTDPVFSNRIGLALGLITGGPCRVTAPAIPLPALPPIDLILISHAHFDHLDRPTLARLNRGTPVVTAVATAELIRDLGFRSVIELRWGERFATEDLLVTACEVRHYGARTFTDWHRGYNGYLLTAGRRRVLFGGDTAYGEHFRTLAPVDLAILGIAAYDPFIAAHATPEQALAMADHLRADRILPMHHSTFRLSNEPLGEPMQRLLKAAGSAADRIVFRDIGGKWIATDE